MKRRMWILALVLAMLLSALPVGAAAEDAQSELYKKTRKSYTSSLASYGKSSFHGYCATLVAYQLRHAGITKKAELCNGNEMYDRYKSKEMSSGGFYIQPYSAKDYSLEGALNAISANGTQDVYNILVGFQWTSTSAGRRFGHTVFINGILDGIVYFVESFDHSAIGDEGTVGQLSISKFAKLYADWTRFEGCIYFTREYADSLERVNTDLFVQATEEGQLWSQPCPVGEEDSVLLRSVSAGERLRVTGILEDAQGQIFYEVRDSRFEGYMPAQKALFYMSNAEDVLVQDLQLPQNIQPQEALVLTGNALSDHGAIRSLDAVVYNASGEEVARVSRDVAANSFDLQQLSIPVLPEGAYTLSLSAQVETPYLQEMQLVENMTTAQLLNEHFWVGPMSRTDHVRSQPVMARSGEGWFRSNGTWYYYENGAPYTGWLWQDGVRYFLDETGAVTTGWAEIGGQTCLFSQEGALCTGWILDDAGMRYCGLEGRFANGWQNIGGSRYYFEAGIMQTEGILTDGVEVYKLQADGKAIVLTEE